MPRPTDTYVSERLGQTVTFDAGVAATEDSGIPAAPTTGGPGPGGGPSGPTPQADGAVPGPTDPLDALQGDYLVRFDNVSTVPHRTLGTVRTATTTFGVLRVTRDGGGLLGTERLCHSQNDQTSTTGTIRTSTDPSVWQNLTPVQRELDVNVQAGTWKAKAATRRQGWKAAASSMPTDLNGQADLFLDPDGDGFPGVATRVSATAPVGGLTTASVTCKYDIVSFATTYYADGKLSSDGLLSSASIVVDADDAHALRAARVSGSADCEASDINNATKPTIESDVLRLKRTAKQWLDTPDACPSLADFKAALP